MDSAAVITRLLIPGVVVVVVDVPGIRLESASRGGPSSINVSSVSRSTAFPFPLFASHAASPQVAREDGVVIGQDNPISAQISGYLMLHCFPDWSVWCGSGCVCCFFFCLMTRRWDWRCFGYHRDSIIASDWH